MSIYSNGNRVAYGIKHYDLESIEDLKNVNKNNLTPGSTIFIINSSKYYKLNNKKQWIEIYPYGIDIVQSDWLQMDDTKFDYIKNKPQIATLEEIINLLLEKDLIVAITDSDGSILVDENNNIITW